MSHVFDHVLSITGGLRQEVQPWCSRASRCLLSLQPFFRATGAAAGDTMLAQRVVGAEGLT